MNADVYYLGAGWLGLVVFRLGSWPCLDVCLCLLVVRLLCVWYGLGLLVGFCDLAGVWVWVFVVYLLLANVGLGCL